MAWGSQPGSQEMLDKHEIQVFYLGFPSRRWSNILWQWRYNPNLHSLPSQVLDAIYDIHHGLWAPVQAWTLLGSSCVLVYHFCNTRKFRKTHRRVHLWQALLWSMVAESCWALLPNGEGRLHETLDLHSTDLGQAPCTECLCSPLTYMMDTALIWDLP